MGINKIYFGNRLLIDLTKDTVSEGSLLYGKTAHDKTGSVIRGTCRFDVDSSDATATKDDILEGLTAYIKGSKINGTMVNQGSVYELFRNKDDVYIIPKGYHDGTGLIEISQEEKEKIIPENILEGITILGVEGVAKPSEITDFTPILTFYDGIEDEDKNPIQDENEEQLLGSYVYHRQ